MSKLHQHVGMILGQLSECLADHNFPMEDRLAALLVVKDKVDTAVQDLALLFDIPPEEITAHLAMIHKDAEEHLVATGKGDQKH